MKFRSGLDEAQEAARFVQQYGVNQLAKLEPVVSVLQSDPVSKFEQLKEDHAWSQQCSATRASRFCLLVVERRRISATPGLGGNAERAQQRFNEKAAPAAEQVEAERTCACVKRRAAMPRAVKSVQPCPPFAKSSDDTKRAFNVCALNYRILAFAPTKRGGRAPASVAMNCTPS